MYAEHLIMFLRKDKGIFLSLQVFFVFFVIMLSYLDYYL